MKRTLLLSLIALAAPYSVSAQCTTTDATNCVCPDGTTDCDLLPDITVSWDALVNYMSGPTEYSQTGNGVENGRLRCTGSTPNIGYGSFTVRGSSYFVCGTDTTAFNPGNCPDGSTPHQLIMQRIYHKDGTTMTYSDRWAGAMTYHPTHNHNHVDDWAVLTLRIEDVNEPNPLNWAIVGDGAKLGFCLMDYGTCTYYSGHCRDVNTVHLQGNNMLNGDFPNYGLGGGQYSCSVVEQGISVGYTDIYNENLDGMWIDIPPGTCNGDYYIVCEVDPHDVFLESDETNNYTAVPFTLTLQDSVGNPTATVTADNDYTICAGDDVTMTANAGTSFLWSTGETTQSITVSAAGTYEVEVTNFCGIATSDPIVVTILSAPSAPTATGDTICTGQTAEVNATGTNVEWHDSNGFLVGTGNNFTTPTLTATTQYFATDVNGQSGVTANTGLLDNSGGGGNFTGDQWLVFDVTESLTINSVKVYADGAGDRTIMLLDAGGNQVTAGTFTVPDGESRINLDFDVPVGNNYELRVNGTPNFYRNNAGVTYPYEIPGTISIHNSSAGADYYYFFYDWEITEGAYACSSPQTTVTVSVDPCIGIDEGSDMNALISVYPNPNNGEFTFSIDVPGTADFNLSVVDMMGKVVYNETLKRITGAYQQDMALQGVAPGIYFVRVDISGQTHYKKLVVK
jgi:hypothetical protein